MPIPMMIYDVPTHLHTAVVGDSVAAIARHCQLTWRYALYCRSNDQALPSGERQGGADYSSRFVGCVWLRA